MGVYTKTGDQGTTGLLTGERVDKDSLRVEAYGSIDEMNSALAMARALCKNTRVTEKIFQLQKLNMMLMADLASVSGDRFIDVSHIALLEKAIDDIEEILPPLASFVTPGDTPGGAALDMARTTARRAERRALTLSKSETVNETVLIVLNRLSDLCFMLMRLEEA